MSDPHAGFFPRAAAFLLDYLVIAVYILILTLCAFFVFKITGIQPVITAISHRPYFSDLLAFISLVLPVMLYFTFSECSSKQATWGKRKMKLAVISMDGQRITLMQSFVRSGIKFLPWQIAHTSLFYIPGWPLHVQGLPIGSIVGFSLVWILVGLYLITLIFSTAHRTPYDWLSKTAVIANPNSLVL